MHTVPTKGNKVFAACKMPIRGLEVLVPQDADCQVEPDRESLCAICQEEFSGLVTRLTCNHAFHHACLILALKEKSMCPLCRTAVDEERFLVPEETVQSLRDKLAEIKQREAKWRPIKEIIQEIRKENLDECLSRIKEHEKKNEQCVAYFEEAKKRMAVLAATLESTRSKIKQQEEKLQRLVEEANRKSQAMHSEIETKSQNLTAQVNRLQSERRIHGGSYYGNGGYLS